MAGLPREVSPAAVLAGLERILAGKAFAESPRVGAFLRFVVQQALENRADRLKEYVIGVEVFGKPTSFDPKSDAIVRVQGGRLRSRLRRYYETEGRDDALRIEIPLRSYAPVFRLRPERENKTALRRGLSAATLVCLVPAIIGGALWWRHPHSSPPPARPPTLTQLTFETGDASFPAVSRDGKLLAYASDRQGEGNLDLWIRPLDGGEPSRLTLHPGTHRQLDFSHDGSALAFRSDREGGGIYVIGLHGPGERRIAEGGYNPRYSPDGAWIAYGAGSVIAVVPASGGAPKLVHPEMEILAGPPLWTPDGAHLLCMGAPLSAHRAPEELDWWVVPVGAGPVIRTGVSRALQAAGLGRVTRLIYPNDWLGDSVVFSAWGGDALSLWQIRLTGPAWQAAGPVLRLTLGGGVHLFPRTAPGERLVFASEIRDTQIWTFPLDARRGAVTGPPVQLTHDASLGPEGRNTRPRLSADGSTLVFSSRRSGNPDVWRKDLEGGGESALVATSLPEDQPLISADGSRVVYRVSQGRTNALYRAEVSVSGARLLCEDCGEPWDWSPDGRWIVYGAGQPETIWSLDTATGRRTEVAGNGQDEFRHAAFSPDGRWLAWVSSPGRLFTARFQGAARLDGAELRLVTGEADDRAAPQWSPDGHLLYFFTQRDDHRCIWAQRLDVISRKPDGPPFAVQHFHGSQNYPWQGSSFAVAQKRLVVILTAAKSNIWMGDLGWTGDWRRFGH